MLAFQYLRWKTTTYYVTNRRIVMRSGIIGRTSFEMLNTKIEQVDVSQDIWGRLFNYGTVLIIGVGGTREPFSYIAAPDAFRAAVQTSTTA
jgi:uncharacterized membrane protein YdbT with pleckstrin-like domain